MVEKFLNGKLFLRWRKVSRIEKYLSLRQNFLRKRKFLNLGKASDRETVSQQKSATGKRLCVGRKFLSDGSRKNV